MTLCEMGKLGGSTAARLDFIYGAKRPSLHSRPMAKFIWVQ